MLFADHANWDTPTLGVVDNRAELALGFKDSLRVVAQSTVPEVSVMLFAFVEPLVNF